MPAYSLLRIQRLSRSTLAIVPLRAKDIFKIKEWRNAQIDVLRQTKILTNEDQKRYYKSSIAPTFRQKEPRQILFSYLNGGRLIGYGGLTNIDWTNRRAEISFLVDPGIAGRRGEYARVFSCFLELLKEVAFDILAFHRIYTETFSFRKHHVRILEKSGFVNEGTMREHVEFRGKYYDSLLHGYLRQEYLS